MPGFFYLRFNIIYHSESLLYRKLFTLSVRTTALPYLQRADVYVDMMALSTTSRIYTMFF